MRLFPNWHPVAPHLALREYVRQLEPEFSLLFRGHENPAQWAEGLRAKLRELAGWPDARCDLQVRELDVTRCEGYARSRLVYTVEPGVDAVAWLCVPHGLQEPVPAVICAHHRGTGPDEIMGLTGFPDPRRGYGLANTLAQAGYVILAPDARCFGERLGDEPGLAVAGAVLGTPLAGRQAWDLSRAVDVLLERADVRARRIGLVGFGMGAQHGLLTAALDDRLYCTALCGGLTTLRELLVAGNCADGLILAGDLLPGLLQWADLDDVACLAAPRALMSLQPLPDAGVPEAGAREFAERVTAGFEVLGEQVKLEALVEPAGSLDCTATVARFLDDWLKLPEPEGQQQLSNKPA